MQAYDDLVELARICLKHAREAKNASVSAELRYMAKGYQVRAASMDKGRFPDIGEEPNSPECLPAKCSLVSMSQSVPPDH